MMNINNTLTEFLIIKIDKIMLIVLTSIVTINSVHIIFS
jgi:hypothetical protein